MKGLSNILFGILVISVIPAAPAHAYLDAATVSMVLQVLTGAAASVLLFGKVHLARIGAFFRRKPAPPPVPAAESPEG